MNSKKVSEFEKLISNQKLREYLKSVSIDKPTQIQLDCIPKILEEGNFAVQGVTGSGKTLGYLLPIIQKLKDLEAEYQSELIAHPKVIILLPTRELALQIFSVAKGISHFAKLRIRKLVGGDKGKSLDSLYSSQIDILITTPDRCLRSFKNKELHAKSLKYLVLDEADQLLEPSFQKTVAELTGIVKSNDMQVYLVSASRPTGYMRIIEGFFPQVKFETIGKGEENVLNHSVKTYNFSLEEEDKFVYVKEFVEKQDTRNGLIFIGNKARSKKVFELIEETGHKKVFLINKDLEVKERIAVVDKFRKVGGILVATDIFARGIDIPHLEWVLNFDIPSEPDYYLHRSGRVGRAGKSGNVFNFITPRDGRRQKKINDALATQGRSDLQIFQTTKPRSKKRK
jgi:superfamily II DNA/RNA helicase